MTEIRKIVIIGPESTGKSSLCEQLALHYDTAWCPEYAREYLSKNGRDYTYDDLLVIARGQLRLEDEYAEVVRRHQGSTSSNDKKNKAPDAKVERPPGILFIDTDMYVMKVWCEFVFGKCHRYILDQILERKYDLYLLCDVDLPWTEDELREHPDPEIRHKLYLVYKDILANQTVPWIEIKGKHEERLRQAIAAIDGFLQIKSKA
jgi:NadR type nicotinamide-nucleotide adenylyltransferase